MKFACIIRRIDRRDPAGRVPPARCQRNRRRDRRARGTIGDNEIVKIMRKATFLSLCFPTARHVCLRQQRREGPATSRDRSGELPHAGPVKLCDVTY
ncbi:hypothetical protein SUGI_0633560 [Cryptomeria japonica]|nr:hypothetical protein SUGI_0633560 [Cryptomeria japonica]